MEKTKEILPVQNGLFNLSSETAGLIVSKCCNCGEMVFPRQNYCPECCTKTMEEKVLNSVGTLKSFTGIYAPTPGYKGEVPYTVGIVEFQEGIRIMGLTTEKTIDHLEAGMDVEIIFDTAFMEDNKEFITFKFKPIF